MSSNKRARVEQVAGQPDVQGGGVVGGVGAAESALEFAVAVPASVADVDPGSMTPEETAQYKKLQWVWCHDCAGGSICKNGWGHKNKMDHNVCSLKDAGKVDDAVREFLFVKRGGRRAQVALTAQKQRAEAGRTRSSIVVPDVYKLDFGQHKGVTLASLFSSEKDGVKDYIPWLFASSHPEKLNAKMVALTVALRAEGYWERTMSRATEMRPRLQREAFDREAEVLAQVAAGQEVRRDEVQLRTWTADKFRSFEQEGAGAAPAVGIINPAMAEYRPPRREHRSIATVENKHCRFCGEVGHMQNGCPLAQRQLEMQNEGLLPTPRAQDLDGVEKKLAQLVAHLKYTWREQRTSQYEERRPRAQESQCVSGHQLCRMSAQHMCEFSLQCELIDGPGHSVCQNPKCDEYFERWGKEWQSGAVNLGPIRARTDVFEVTKHTAWQRCPKCRRAHTVHAGNPLYSLRDRLEEANYAWWMFINAASLTLTALHMGRKEDLVRRYFHQAATICAHDAENRQARIVFGHRYPYTTVIESDETRIGKFKVTIDGIQYHYHLVLLVIEARGDPSSLWLLLVGRTRSAEKSRVPPLKHYIWRMVARTLFDDESYIVNLTDGALVYRQKLVGIVDQQWCNHQNKEWTKSVEVPYNLETGEMRQTFASTNFLDGEHRKLKEQVPRGIRVDTMDGVRLKMKYFRAAQWRKITRGEDKWQAFCEAAHSWRSTQAQAGNVDVTGAPEFPEDEPGEEDELDAVEDDATIEEAGLQPVPFGFEVTGERDLLMRERRVREALKAERAHTAQVARPPIWVGAETDSDGSETSELEVSDLQLGTPLVSELDDAQAYDEDAPLRMVSEEAWADRYFEKQEGAACGKHALNNLCGGPQFVDDDMVVACSQVLAETGEEENDHRSGHGWYSHSVLARVVQNFVPPAMRLLTGPFQNACNPGRSGVKK